MPADQEMWTAPYVRAGRNVWPQIELPADLFASYLQSRCPSGPPELERAPDLYLACACVHAVPGAAEAFDRAHSRDLHIAVSRIDVRRHGVDDLLQLLREKLLVGTSEEPPLLSSYAGRGSLSGWLRILATRTALNIDRGERRRDTRESASVAQEIDIGQLDPELAHLRQLYVKEFKEAFEAAIHQMTERSRALLRQSIVHKLTSRQIGELYNVHHATAARWIATAREELIAQTHTSLAQRLSLDPAALDDILALIRSQVDITVSRVLR